MTRATNYNLTSSAEPMVIYDICRFAHQHKSIPYSVDAMLQYLCSISKNTTNVDINQLFTHLQNISPIIQNAGTIYTINSLKRMLWMITNDSNEPKKRYRLLAVRVGCETEQQKMNNLILEV